MPFALFPSIGRSFVLQVAGIFHDIGISHCRVNGPKCSMSLMGINFVILLTSILQRRLFTSLLLWGTINEFYAFWCLIFLRKKTFLTADDRLEQKSREREWDGPTWLLNHPKAPFSLFLHFFVCRIFGAKNFFFPVTSLKRAVKTFSPEI